MNTSASGEAVTAHVHEILRALAVLYTPGQGVELRAFRKHGAIVSGLYDDHEALARDAATVSAENDAEVVYVTLNPVRPSAVEGLVTNTLAGAAQGTHARDDDIARRQWLPIDIDTDPHEAPATEEQHTRALATAHSIRDWLRSDYGVEAIVADSGNGGHVLVRIDLPNDDASKQLVKRVLQAVAKKYGTDGVSVDTSVFNAARMWKLYGTLVRKGDEAPGRPYRVARLLDVPEGMSPVPREVLERIAASVPDEGDLSAPRPASTIAQLLEGVAEGGRNVAATKIVGHFLSRREDESVIWQVLVGWNQKNTPPLPEAELRRTFESILHRHRARHAGPVVLSARELMRMEFPKRPPVIHQLLPEGLTLLGARPKAGKSLLALRAAVTAAAGRQMWPLPGTLALAKYQTTFQARRGEVLYIPYEESEQLVHKRLRALDVPEDAIDNLDFGYNWPQADDGGLEALEAWLDEHPQAALIVIDHALSFFGEVEQRGGVVQHDYRQMKQLADVARERGVAILLLIHLTKAAMKNIRHGGDVFDYFLNTTGTTAAADMLWALVRRDGDEPTTLAEFSIRARDSADRTYTLRMEIVRGADETETTATWMIESEAPLPRITDAQKDVLELYHSAERPLSRAEVNALAKQELDKADVSSTVQELRKKGLLLHEGKKDFLSELGRRFFADGSAKAAGNGDVNEL